MDWLGALLQFLGGIFKKSPEKIEPVLEGYNELVENLRTQVQGLFEQVERLSGELGEARTAVRNMQLQMNDLEDRLSNCEDLRRDLQIQVDLLRNNRGQDATG